MNAQHITKFNDQQTREINMKNTYSKTFKRSIMAIAVGSILSMNSAFADDLIGKIVLTNNNTK